MAKKPNITTISSGYYSRQALNSNFEALREAFDNTISRDGSSPNTMTGSLDMNGNAILNTGQIDVESLTVNGSPVGNISSLLNYRSTWLTGTSYVSYDVVVNNGSSYLCLVSHTSGTFVTDLSAGKWGLLAQVGASGGGSGDLVSTNNLSDVADVNTSLSNLGGQPLNDILTDLSGLTQTAGTVPYFDTSTTASLLSFLDEDDMASNSATAVPSQQSVKAYVDTQVSAISAAPIQSAGLTFPVGSYVFGVASNFGSTNPGDTFSAATYNITLYGATTQEYVTSGTWKYLGREGGNNILYQRIA